MVHLCKNFHMPEHTISNHALLTERILYPGGHIRALQYIGISSCVAVPVRGRFGFWPFRFFGRFGLWPFRFVAVSVCGRFGLWPFQVLAIPVCGHSGLWPFRFVAISVVAVSVCGRYDLLP